MKTLLVKYTPREERSSSKKLLDIFRNEIKNSEIEILDLCVDVPDMFNVESINAYIRRNYLQEELLLEQKVTLAKMDRMTQQMKSADIVVVAFPMHNFSMPASVKAWFDSVMLKGQTWNNVGGKYFGLMEGKKALIIISSGGFYTKEPMMYWEHAMSLAKIEFQFMGFSDVRGILAEGMNADDEIKTTNMQKSMDEIKIITQDWFRK
ncbi:FMN-dependent NADH-azoreductase [Candidatus Nitrosotalea bavarica]|uniref:FMN-dependent NADH-azoreductase n=1 Tax=Candidatus Nitrosotalea bavarica TaxID=1903277 RepID=UPI0013FDE67D|nr:NAD(P)H-dependent oxidoreductase [Candidatus Nitrosotalea bavarica]